ncbi:acyltransferase [Membranihabitans marinus]|uniref:acyltransferase n=1 Tax=Membranihabitans marinus TaxID=1227546 RepID=UPI001F175810|nr:acyltransferase [Membranihabitans marinus]
MAEKPKDDFFVHSSAFVDGGVHIGAGSKVWHFCHIMSGARLGENCILGQNVFVGPGVEMGQGCKIQNNVSLYAGLRLEDHVFVGPSVVFTNVTRPRAFIEQKNNFAPTHIGLGATIGANATIVCGHSIGRYAMVAAGGLVTRDVPDYALVIGQPARFAAWICQCGQNLEQSTEDEYHCPHCERKYHLVADQIKPKI